MKHYLAYFWPIYYDWNLDNTLATKVRLGNYWPSSIIKPPLHHLRRQWHPLSSVMVQPSGLIVVVHENAAFISGYNYGLCNSAIFDHEYCYIYTVSSGCQPYQPYQTIVSSLCVLHPLHATTTVGALIPIMQRISYQMMLSLII